MISRSALKENVNLQRWYCCDSVSFCICLDFLFSTHRPFRKGEFFHSHETFACMILLVWSFMWVTDHVFVGLLLSLCISVRIESCVKIPVKEIITYSTLCWPEPAQNRGVSLGCLMSTLFTDFCLRPLFNPSVGH